MVIMLANLIAVCTFSGARGDDQRRSCWHRFSYNHTYFSKGVILIQA